MGTFDMNMMKLGRVKILSHPRRFLSQWLMTVVLLACGVSACSSGGSDPNGGPSVTGPSPSSGGSGAVATGSPGDPVILFTDVEAGPKQGGPGNQGVPISVFGKGFGTQRGSSTVTINGTEVATYLVWGEHNANNSALDMIVVQPGSSVTAGPIVVRVNGKDSNTDYHFTPVSGAIYYVAPVGSDSAVCSETAPCLTIHHVATAVMQSGDVVLVRGGTSTESEVWIREDMGQSGQPGRPKLIRNYPGEDPILNNAARPFIINANYITVSGLHFRNGKSIGMGNEDNHHNQVINSTFRGTIGFDAVGAHGDNHLLAGNDCHVSGSTVGTQGHCYYISHGRNLKIRYNIGRGATGYGLHIFDQRRATPDIQRVISNILVEGNLLAGSTLRSGMIVAMADEGGLGNHIDGITIQNNVFTGNNHLGLIFGGIVRNVKVYHNTFSRNGRQGLYIGDEATLSGFDVRNNLFDQTVNAFCTSNCSWYQDAHIQRGVKAQGVSVVNNFYVPAPMMLIGATDPAGMAGSAGFVNGDGWDFHLQDSSPALNQGIALLAVLRDFDGRLRPTSGTPDPGAFEHP